MNNYGDPPNKSTFVLTQPQAQYEFTQTYDNIKVFRIDKVIIRGDNNERIIYTAGTASETNKEYTEDSEFNTITFHADTISAHDGQRVEVHYVPQSIKELVRAKAGLYLLDLAAVTNSEENTPTLGLRLIQRITRMEKAINPPVAIGSTNELGYDPTLGEEIIQRRFRVLS